LPKSLKIWNDEVKEAIENKKRAYRKYFQDKTATTEKDYHQKRNIAKAVVRKTQKSLGKIL
jgi:hypothetical protein